MLIISHKQLLQCFNVHICRYFMKLDGFTSWNLRYCHYPLNLRGFLVWSVFTAIRNSSASRLIEESATGNTCRILYFFSFLAEKREIMKWSNGNNKRNYWYKAAVKKECRSGPPPGPVGIDRSKSRESEKVKVEKSLQKERFCLNRVIRLMYAFLNLNNDLYSCRTL